MYIVFIDSREEQCHTINSCSRFFFLKMYI